MDVEETADAMSDAMAGDAVADDAPSDEASDEDALAILTAARGFVISAWVGAALLTFSYAQLYWSWLADDAYEPSFAVPAGVVTAILGGVMHVRSHRIWRSLDVPVGRRSMAVARLVAGAGGIFWLLLIVLAVLWRAGVEIMPL